MFARKLLNAARPPADAPMATIGKESGDFIIRWFDLEESESFLFKGFFY